VPERVLGPGLAPALALAQVRARGPGLV